MNGFTQYQQERLNALYTPADPYDSQPEFIDVLLYSNLEVDLNHLEDNIFIATESFKSNKYGVATQGEIGTFELRDNELSIEFKNASILVENCKEFYQACEKLCEPDYYNFLVSKGEIESELEPAA